MKDLRSTQIVIPMDYTPRQVKEYAKQHWNITFARQKKVSIYAKRIMALVLGQIRDSDEDFLPFYRFHVNEVSNTGEDNTAIYRNVKNAFNELTDLKWLIEDLDKKKFAYRHLLNTSDARCGYSEGYITVVLNPLLKEFFIAMSHYSTYELKHYMGFKSWYSMRLFELLSAFRDTGSWTVSIPKYRELMDCVDKYPKTPDLLKYTLQEPLEELEETDFAFEYVELFDQNHLGRGRKPVVALEFTLKKITLKEIPDSWMNYSEEHKTTINLLRNTYFVDDKVIIKYIKAIGIKRVKELIKLWYDMKRDNKMTNVKAYCNKVFQAEGKKALENLASN